MFGFSVQVEELKLILQELQSIFNGFTMHKFLIPSQNITKSAPMNLIKAQKMEEMVVEYCFTSSDCRTGADLTDQFQPLTWLEDYVLCQDE